MYFTQLADFNQIVYKVFSIYDQLRLERGAFVLIQFLLQLL